LFSFSRPQEVISTEAVHAFVNSAAETSASLLKDAPNALYPDALVAQILSASTF
jgi:hypothetical protein